MSYSRTFSRTIHIHYSGSVSYPASQSGGSVSYSGTASETVNVTVEVDTHPFDRSVDHCNSNVQMLTGAIVATEAAQIESIRQSAQKVGNTIVSGFFKTVRYEISQQIAELKNKVDATLVHLQKMAQHCLDKQQQMQQDYARICSRYIKIFNDLDNELENRVHEISRPAFNFFTEANRATSLIIGSDLVTTAAVAGTENARLETQIRASVVKRQTLATIDKASAFIKKQKMTDAIIRSSIMDEAESGTYHIPVCLVEATDDKSQSLHRQTFGPQLNANVGDLTDRMASLGTWHANDAEGIERIRTYFNNEMNANPPADKHSDRVRNTMAQLFNISNTQIL